MARNISYSIVNDIANITLTAQNSKVNILNSDFMSDLEQVAIELSREQSVKGAIISSSKSGGFIAGADISEIEHITDPGRGSELAAAGQRVFGLWEALPFPVIAAIHGHCMGGGTEFALACHYRIASDSLNIALPEVKLGILPGFGGTQRLPRLISIEKSIDIILSGRTLRGPEALNLGLIDRLVPIAELSREAEKFTKEIITGDTVILASRRKKISGIRQLLLERNPIGRSVLFSQARQQLIRKTGGNYPAPIRALDVMKAGLKLSLIRGLELEAKALGEMIVTPVSKNLVHLFHLSQRPKKFIEKNTGSLVVTKAAVLGAGVMGGGIAHLLASKKIPTILKDINQEALKTGIDHARKLFQKEIKKRREPESDLSKKMGLLTASLNYDGFKDVDLIIEAVVEKMPVKKAVLQETEPHLSGNALFASNTSALSITELQGAAQRPGQIGGLHFFNPVDKMPLVEVVNGEATSTETTGALFHLATTLGKTPIITSDKTGFLVNRLLVTYLLEAALTAEEGVDWQSIDTLITDFGYPMGPFRLVDEVGIDIAAEVGDTLCHSFSYLKPTKLLHDILAKGLLGKKKGTGFYQYDIDGKVDGINLEFETILPTTGRKAGPTELKRLIYLMVNEAGRCLEEGVIAAPEDVDTGMVFGTGFPPFHGGLCRWADAEGLPEIVRTLEALSSQHGERFSPCNYLKNKSFFY